MLMTVAEKQNISLAGALGEINMTQKTNASLILFYGFCLITFLFSGLFFINKEYEELLYLMIMFWMFIFFLWLSDKFGFLD